MSHVKSLLSLAECLRDRDLDGYAFEVVDAANYIHKQGQRIAELEAERRWIPIVDELPAIGQPVLLAINRVVQHETWMLDSADNEMTLIYWFEPYGGGDGEHSIGMSESIAWMPLPPPPEDNTATGATVPGSRKP